MKRVFVSVAAVLFGGFAMAQSSGEMQLSLSDAVTSAMQYSKQLQASKMDTELYAQKVRETRSSGLPQVSASLGYTTYFGKELEMMGMSIDMEDAISLTATASYTLSFQQLASVKLTKISTEVAEQSIASDVLSVKANVINTYYTILIYKRNLEILEQNLKDLEDLRDHTQKMYEVGVSEQTDVDQILVNVVTVKNSLISLERSYDVAKRLLVLQMGLPIETKIATTTSLDELIVDSTVAMMDSSNFDITQNLDYKLLELSNAINEQTLVMYRRSYIPTLTLSYSYTNPIKGGFMTFDHVGAATLTVPIFKGLQRDAQVKQAKIEVARGETNMELLKDNLNQSEEQYRYELNTAIEAFLLQKENLDVAKRVLENYRNKYNQGSLSSLEFTQANTNYLTAETSYASACLTLLTAHTQLSKLYNNFEY